MSYLIIPCLILCLIEISHLDMAETSPKIFQILSKNKFSFYVVSILIRRDVIFWRRGGGGGGCYLTTHTFSQRKDLQLIFSVRGKTCVSQKMVILHL